MTPYMIDFITILVIIWLEAFSYNGQIAKGKS
jgi:hypothetical protein